MPPSILVVADTPGWAWDRKAREYQRLDGFDVSVAYMTQGLPDLRAFDLVHLFEVSQGRVIPDGFDRPVVAGLTALVWWTWGRDRMQAWADRCAALHGNSPAIVQALHSFHSRVFYVPNGVDPAFWTPGPPATHPVVACHVGKPNPRKGAALIVAACQRASVPLLLCQRTSHIRLTPEEIRTLYRSSAVQVTASDMDGTPNPMLEAAACGSALISTPIGNMPEVIREGENGVLVGRSLVPDPFRPWIAALVEPHPEALPAFARWPADEIRDRREGVVSEMAAALTRMRDDPAGTARMGRAARQTILDGWTWDHQRPAVAAMWTAVLR